MTSPYQTPDATGQEDRDACLVADPVDRHVNHLAADLTELSMQLEGRREGFSFGCEPTLRWEGHRRAWLASVSVKPSPKRSRQAWSTGDTPEHALTVLLVAVAAMACGDRPVEGGEVR